MKEYEYSEYNIQTEEWIAPMDEEPATDEAPAKDEPATLGEGILITKSNRVKKDIVKSRKARKKRADMLNKSTGLLVSAAAVVMLAWTLPNQQSTCQVCHVDYCEFWLEILQCEYFNPNIICGSFRTTPSGDNQQMGYFQSDEGEAIFDETYAIQLLDGRRAYMRHLTEEEEYMMHCNKQYALKPQNETAIQRLVYVDDKTGSEVVVELIYMPRGEEPEKTMVYNAKTLKYVQLKQAVIEDNLWVRVACDDRRVDLEYVLNVSEVYIVDAHAYDVGNTLRFFDDKDVIRIWGDRNDYGSVRVLDDNGKELFRIECDYVGRRFNVCNVNGFEYVLEIADVAYETLYENWVNKIEIAKERGHRIYNIYQLENVECNNIIYQVYLQDKESAVGYDGYNLVLSPVHEKNFGVIISVDELVVDAATIQNRSALADILTEENVENVYQVLDNIYLRDDMRD